MDNTDIKNFSYNDIMKKYQIMQNSNSSEITDSIYSDVLVELLGGKIGSGFLKMFKKRRRRGSIDRRRRRRRRSGK